MSNLVSRVLRLFPLARKAHKSAQYKWKSYWNGDYSLALPEHHSHKLKLHHSTEAVPYEVMGTILADTSLTLVRDNAPDIEHPEVNPEWHTYLFDAYFKDGSLVTARMHESFNLASRTIDEVERFKKRIEHYLGIGHEQFKLYFTNSNLPEDYIGAVRALL